MTIKYQLFIYQYLLIYFLTPGTGRLFGVLPLGQISLALLVLAFVYKLKDMRLYYNKNNIYEAWLIFLITVMVAMIIISMFVSNDASNSIYQATRILAYVFLPFFFILMLRYINVDKIIDLLIFIALAQVGFAVIEEVAHVNIFDYAFTYVVDYREEAIRFDLYRVHTNMGPLSLAFLFLTVYPLSYYKNSMFYKIARYIIPLGMVMTVSIAGMFLMLFSIVALNYYKLKKLFSMLKLLIVIAILFSLGVYFGVVEKVVTAFSMTIDAISTLNEAKNKAIGINAKSRFEGVFQMFKLMGEHLFSPIGYGELYNNWDRYMPFNTDPGIPLMWGVEIGVWALSVYIMIFLISFKLLITQKTVLSKYFLLSLFMYMLMSFTTNHTDTLLTPFIILGIALSCDQKLKNGN